MKACARQHGLLESEVVEAESLMSDAAHTCATEGFDDTNPAI
jgi:hypothetical protein